MSAHRVRLVTLGFGLSLSLSLLSGTSGCGLRTDHNFEPICVDDSVADTEGETAGETDGPPPDPRSGSCQNPISLPTGNTITVKGSLGGCSGTEGWCGGTGGEDVYRLLGNGGDVFVTFLPQFTNFNPVMRVVRGDPCEEATLETSEVCAPITNSVPGRGFWQDPNLGNEYFLIVDTELGDSGDYAFRIDFGGDAFGDDCDDAIEEQVIELSAGGNFVWESSLHDEQGRLDSSCGAPGDEDIFSLVLTGAGTLDITVEVLSGEIEPVISLRNGCSTQSEVKCGATINHPVGSSNTALLVVDQLGAAEGRYRLTVNY